MITLSATQTHALLTLLEDTGYVRIVLVSQDPNSLVVRAMIGGAYYEISDLGTTRLPVV